MQGRTLSSVWSHCPNKFWVWRVFFRNNYSAYLDYVQLYVSVYSDFLSKIFQIGISLYKTKINKCIWSWTFCVYSSGCKCITNWTSKRHISNVIFRLRWLTQLWMKPMKDSTHNWYFPTANRFSGGHKCLLEIDKRYPIW